MGGSSLEGEQQGAHGMTGAEWRVATALFTAGEVIAPAAFADCALHRTAVPLSVRLCAAHSW